MESFDKKHFYSNNANITIGLYECQFLFKLSSSDLKKDIDEVYVHVSPMHAKAIYTILKKNIEVYEDKFGKLDIPEDVLKRLITSGGNDE